MIQIWGTKKCRDTQKAIRFFKERRVPVQFIDLNIKGMSAGEIRSVYRALGSYPIDREGKNFQKVVRPGVNFDPERLLEEHPEVLLTPVVRNAKQATVGHQPNIWQIWVEEMK